MKNKNILLRLLSLAAVLALVAAMALTLASCGSKKDIGAQTEDASSSEQTGSGELGGETDNEITVTVTVKGSDGNSTDFSIKTTDGASLRSALESIDLIEGEEGQFGLYVKVVNGERADFEKDGAYWSFSRNGEYLMSGVDTIYVKDGDKFEIIYTK